MISRILREAKQFIMMRYSLFPMDQVVAPPGMVSVIPGDAALKYKSVASLQKALTAGEDFTAARNALA